MSRAAKCVGNDGIYDPAMIVIGEEPDGALVIVVETVKGQAFGTRLNKDQALKILGGLTEECAKRGWLT